MSIILPGVRAVQTMIERRRPFNRIFGIGLPKTGTTSLAAALELLGFQSLHCPRRFREMIHAGQYFFPEEHKGKRWDALTNFGEQHWEQLDKAFPGSKFILTTRKTETWLESCSQHYAKPRKGIHGKATLEIFGMSVFHEARFRAIMRGQAKSVIDYFKHKPGRLLVVNLCGNPGWLCWKHLCQFLGEEQPDQVFPHNNRRYH